MSSSDLIRWGRLAAIVAGVMLIVHGLLGLTVLNTDESTPLDVLVILSLLLQAVGLVGFHALQKENYGRIGRAGLYTFIAGAVAHGLGLLLLLPGSETLAEPLLAVGGIGMLVGLVLYGAASLQARCCHVGVAYCSLFSCRSRYS